MRPVTFKTNENVNAGEILGADYDHWIERLWKFKASQVDERVQADYVAQKDAEEESEG